MKSDLQLHRDITDEFNWDPQLRESEIGVAVKDGVVTLSGKVPTFAQKHAAERAAQRVTGVRALADDLEVKPSGIFVRSDTDIAHAAVSALKWNASVPADKVSIKVEDGWITLSGKLSWRYQSEAAERAMRALVGVHGISNLIVLSPPASEKIVSQHIEAALERSAQVEAKGIKVEVLDGKVTLKGKVHSWSERREAERAAWSSPGVRFVEDQLLVSA
jgi:osmotically-inducible protein OsmY